LIKQFLLDTNACIDYLKNGNKSLVKSKLDETELSAVFLCSIVTAELLVGSEKLRRLLRPDPSIEEFIRVFRSLPFDEKSAKTFAIIRDTLESQGIRKGVYDMMIAAIAVANNMTLVTHNTKDFEVVPGLIFEDWQV
jgi:tRNA(fMet)-specific endonuclease VapC